MIKEKPIILQKSDIDAFTTCNAAIPDNIPPHILERIKHRKAHGYRSFAEDYLKSKDLDILNLRGGLLYFDDSGQYWCRANGDPTGSANEERKDTADQNITALKNKYPRYWAVCVLSLKEPPITASKQPLSTYQKSHQ